MLHASVRNGRMHILSGIFMLYFLPISQSQIVIRDSSDPLVDGVYFNFGTANGRNYYQKFNGVNNDFVMEWDGGKWIIKDLVTSTIYYSSTLDTQDPPCNYWSIDQMGYQSIIVNGTPCVEVFRLIDSDEPNINGDYFERGTANTRNVYQNSTGGEITWNPTSIYGIGWELTYSGSVYYHNATNLPIPPCTSVGTWTPVLGNDPIMLKGDCALYFPNDISVSGNGFQFYYGTYQRILKAQINNKSVYENPFNLFFGPLTMEWDASASEWRLGITGNPAFHTNPGTDAEPPCTGWTDYTAGGNTYSITLSNNCSFIVAAPVEWLGFWAEKVAEGVQLTWATATEENNQGFTVERASLYRGNSFSDSLSWEALHFEEGQKSSQAAQEYTYIDPNHLPGAYLYRLRQEDFDGKYSYSTLKEILIEASAFSLEIHPNPASETATLLFPAQDLPVEIEVWNTLGQKWTLPINDRGEISLSSLPEGMYTLSVSTKLQSYYTSLIKRP